MIHRETPLLIIQEEEEEAEGKERPPYCDPQNIKSVGRF